jgi:hypothetical protein
MAHPPPPARTWRCTVPTTADPPDDRSFRQQAVSLLGDQPRWAAILLTLADALNRPWIAGIVWSLLAGRAALKTGRKTALHRSPEP